jgi:electron transport complex protein RnfB
MTTGPTRRDLLRTAARCTAVLALGGGAAALLRRAQPAGAWSIDPSVCTGCDGCASGCVVPGSAVRCVNDFDRCGYCAVCYGYFKGGIDAVPVDEPANRICPQEAIIRRRVGDLQWEYTIDPERCDGCGACVAPCRTYGHASFRLRVDAERCLDCSRCGIASACMPQAIAWRAEPVTSEEGRHG